MVFRRISIAAALVAIASSATAAPPVAITEPSICGILADQMNFTKAQDKINWIRACKNGKLALKNLVMSGEREGGSTFLSVDIADLGPLVDPESIRVTFSVAGQPYTTVGGGTARRTAEVSFDPCTTTGWSEVSAKATWRTRPAAGSAGSGVTFSTRLVRQISSGIYNVHVIPKPGRSGLVEANNGSIGLIFVNHQSGTVITLRRIELFCSHVDGWTPCGTNPYVDWWIPVANSPLMKLPATLACGDSVNLSLQSVASSRFARVVFTYTDELGVEFSIIRTLQYVEFAG